MDIENSITNHTEFSGGNDTSDSSAAEQHKDSSAAEQHKDSSAAEQHKDSSAAEQHKDSSAAEQHKAKAISPEDAVRNIVRELLALGHKGPQIIQIVLYNMTSPFCQALQLASVRIGASGKMKSPNQWCPSTTTPKLKRDCLGTDNKLGEDVVHIYVHKIQNFLFLYTTHTALRRVKTTNFRAGCTLNSHSKCHTTPCGIKKYTVSGTTHMSHTLHSTLC
ncbi:hypothetical protein PSHT_06355 [Puccinia striiformis]|uniref:Uncharacterized protein n=1 Tax=Puccinia striiformis TaxID=27350 RepID=A0A2S4W747_9BASI|nr:hypothetical protein PSHT_06355 [Puccinia striiformis]